MKRIITSVLYVVTFLLLAGCAKQVAPGPNDAKKRVFDAWMKLNHPEAKPTGLGIYIIEDTPGTGTEVKENGFAFLDYIIRDLSGNISAYTDKGTAKQLGDYDTTKYYGYKAQSTVQGSLAAGLSEAIIGMKVGGHRKVVVPGWLVTFDEYETEEEYIKKADAGDNTIYDITIHDFTENMGNWQVRQIGNYLWENREVFAPMAEADSLSGHKGFYYKQLRKPTDNTAISSDTTVYINYTGRLLNGLVFDTNIERVAKDNGLYSTSKSYEPVQINWGEEYEDITMGSSSSTVIKGFALTLWQMKSMEKGIGIFTSDYGYGASGSNSNIPGYAPLIFEIELVKDPND